jgi:hypothetical protein
MKLITRKELPSGIDGEIYMYKSHPNPAQCKIVNNKVNMICTQCNSNITNNWCQCSLPKKLLHEDRILMRNAIKSHKHTFETCKKFLEMKGCNIEHFKSIFKDETGTQHGKGEGTWSFDHIISPVSNFDLTKQNHREFIFHYKNIQKMIYPTNQKKGCKVNQAEINYVLSVIDTMEIDKIHDQLKIMRNNQNNIKPNNNLTHNELLNENHEQISEHIGEPICEKKVNTNKQLKLNSVIPDRRKDYPRETKKEVTSSDLWKINIIINKLIKDREKEENNIKIIRKKIISINDLINIEIEKSCSQIKKENCQIDKQINLLQNKKMKNDESLALLSSYVS